MSKATRRFIVNKVLEMLITLVVVTLISFLLVRLSPIDPAEAYARRSFAAFSFTDEQMEALREDMGLNDPLPVQYVTWVRDALHLDFGESFVSGQPVFEKVTTAIGIIDFSRYSSSFHSSVRLSLLSDKKKNDWPCADFSVHCRGVHPILFLCQFLPRYFCCQARFDIGGRKHGTDAVSPGSGLYRHWVYRPVFTHAGE